MDKKSNFILNNEPSNKRLRNKKKHNLGNRIRRLVWSVIWLVFYRPSPRVFHGWRRLLLKLFGAKLGIGVHPYPSARIWAPWNLQMGDHSCLGEHVDCYCVDTIVIGAYSTISQYCFLCTASHDYSDLDMPLITSPIIIGERVWVTADVFIAPGVQIGEGAVVLARSSVFQNVDSWMVVAGNPAKLIKRRLLKSDEGENVDESK